MYYRLRSPFVYGEAMKMSRDNPRSAELWEFVTNEIVYDPSDTEDGITRVQFATVMRTTYQNRVLVFGEEALVISAIALPRGVDSTLDNIVTFNSSKVFSDTVVLSDDERYLYNQSALQPLSIVFYNGTCTVVANVVTEDIVLDSATIHNGARIENIKDYNPKPGTLSIMIKEQLLVI